MKKYLLILSTMLLVSGNISFAENYDTATQKYLYDTASDENDVKSEKRSREKELANKDSRGYLDGNVDGDIEEELTNEDLIRDLYGNVNDDINDRNYTTGRPATASWERYIKNEEDCTF